MKFLDKTGVKTLWNKVVSSMNAAIDSVKTWAGNTYLPLSGGTVNGSLKVSGDLDTKSIYIADDGIHAKNENEEGNIDLTFYQGISDKEMLTFFYNAEDDTYGIKSREDDEKVVYATNGGLYSMGGIEDDLKKKADKSPATASTDGLMAAADKAKLDSIEGVSLIEFSKIDTLNTLKSCGFYKVVSPASGSLATLVPIGYLLVFYDTMRHGFSLTLISNLPSDNGTIDGSSHVDGGLFIYHRYYSATRSASMLGYETLYNVGETSPSKVWSKWYTISSSVMAADINYRILYLNDNLTSVFTKLNYNTQGFAGIIEDDITFEQTSAPVESPTDSQVYYSTNNDCFVVKGGSGLSAQKYYNEWSTRYLWGTPTPHPYKLYRTDDGAYYKYYEGQGLVKVSK